LPPALETFKKGNHLFIDNTIDIDVGSLGHPRSLKLGKTSPVKYYKALLRKFKDFFTWEYFNMDKSLISHNLVLNPDYHLVK